MNVTQFMGSGSPQTKTGEIASIARNSLGNAGALNKGINALGENFAQLQNLDLDSLIDDSEAGLTGNGQNVPTIPELSQQPPSQGTTLHELTDEPAEDASAINGDNKQNLLAYLLDIAEPTQIQPALHRLASSPVATTGAELIEPSTAIASAVKTVQAQSMTGAVNDRVSERISDSKVPVLPLFFGQSLVAAKDDTNAGKNLDHLASAPLNAVRPLMASIDSIKPVLPTGSESQVQSQDSGNRMQWSPIKLQGNHNQMAEQLHSVLRERLQIQTDSKTQQATIRLDPPSMGKIDISLHMEAGKLNIQINAAQTDVYRALQQVSNDLRQHLVEQNFLQVNVQVSSDSSQQGQQGRKQPANEEIQVAQEIEISKRSGRSDDSILTTV